MQGQALEDRFGNFRDTGDPESLGRVFDQTAGRLRAVAVRVCGDGTEADDAVQATFVAAIESAARWEPDRPLWPWLVGILQNCLRSRYRERHRTIDWQRFETQGPPEPAHLIASVEFASAVENALAGLWLAFPSAPRAPTTASIRVGR